MVEYFRAVNSIDELKYVFNKLKTADVGEVKKQVQAVFSGNAKLLFEANPDLFKSLKSEDGAPLIIQTWQQLEGLAKSNPEFYKSSLFDFIEIK